MSVAAGESHWQLGRAEAHGRVIKQMLTSMDVEEPICSPDDFRRSLRQAFSAKNSLSNVGGFTPEQAVMGKSRSLPGSLISDGGVGTHSLAESESPEGIDFRNSLRRREMARKAFLTADNHSSLRRALLRRTRKDPNWFEKGDWVLYWRQNKGHIKGERGRWHGPGQIIVVEKSKVVWISHGGYLIRASPQQLRPASMREHLTLTRDPNGRIVDEVIRNCKNYVQLEGIPEDMDEAVNPEANSVSRAVSVSNNASQPEGEHFPSEPRSSISPEPSILNDLEIPQVESSGDNPDFDLPVEVPIPDMGMMMCCLGMM